MTLWSDKCLCTYHSGIFDQDLEPKILQASDALLAQLADNDTNIGNMVARVQKDEVCSLYKKCNRGYYCI